MLLTVALVCGVLGAVGYGVYQFRIRSAMHQEIRAIMRQYMPLQVWVCCTGFNRSRELWFGVPVLTASCQRLKNVLTYFGTLDVTPVTLCHICNVGHACCSGNRRQWRRRRCGIQRLRTVERPRQVMLRRLHGHCARANVAYARQASLLPRLSGKC